MLIHGSELVGGIGSGAGGILGLSVDFLGYDTISQKYEHIFRSGMSRATRENSWVQVRRVAAYSAAIGSSSSRLRLAPASPVSPRPLIAEDKPPRTGRAVECAVGGLAGNYLKGSDLPETCTCLTYKVSLSAPSASSESLVTRWLQDRPAQIMEEDPSAATRHGAELWLANWLSDVPGYTPAIVEACAARSWYTSTGYGWPITRIWKTGVVITCNYSVITTQL